MSAKSQAPINRPKGQFSTGSETRLSKVPRTGIVVSVVKVAKHGNDMLDLIVRLEGEEAGKLDYLLLYCVTQTNDTIGDLNHVLPEFERASREGKQVKVSYTWEKIGSWQITDFVIEDQRFKGDPASDIFA